MDKKRLEVKVEESVLGLEKDVTAKYQRVIDSLEILDKECTDIAGSLTQQKENIKGQQKAMQALAGSHKELASSHSGLVEKHGVVERFAQSLEERTGSQFQGIRGQISLLFEEVSQRIECIGNLREQIDALGSGYGKLVVKLEDEIQVRGVYLDSFRAIVQHLQGIWEIYGQLQSRMGKHEVDIANSESRHDGTVEGFEQIHAKIEELAQKDLSVSEEIMGIESNFTGLQDGQSKIFNTLDQYRSEMSKHDTWMSKQSEQTKELEGLISKVSSNVEQIPGSVKEVQNRINKLDITLEQLRDFTQVQGQCINTLTTRLSDLREGSEVAAKDSGVMQKNLKELRGYTTDLQEKLEYCSQSLKEFSKEVSMLAYADALSRSGLAMPTMSYDDLDIKKLSWINSTVRRKPNLNSIVFQSKPRLMTANDYKLIEDNWLPVLGIKDLNRSGLSYMAHRICNVELMTHGRYATSIQDALLRLVVLRSFQGKEPISLLEIGTLFGLNIACAWDLSSVLQLEFSATVIDPLDGYYKDGKNDTATSIPVNEYIFWQNLEKVGCPRDRVNLIKGQSQEQFVQDRVSGFQFNYILIDGDHSYEGVKNDFERFTPFLKPGGVLLVDDYSSTEWPDVTKFVDDVIRKDSGFEFVISEWRTALFRKV